MTTTPEAALSDEVILEIGRKHFRPGHDVKAEANFIAAVRDCLAFQSAEIARLTEWVGELEASNLANIARAAAFESQLLAQAKVEPVAWVTRGDWCPFLVTGSKSMADSWISDGREVLPVTQPATAASEISAPGRDALADSSPMADAARDALSRLKPALSVLHTMLNVEGLSKGAEVAKELLGEIEHLELAKPTAVATSEELSLREQYEDACIKANKNARYADYYRWLRRRAWMLDCSDSGNMVLTLTYGEGPTGEFLDDQMADLTATKEQP
jgi:hypothetical protein